MPGSSSCDGRARAAVVSTASNSLALLEAAGVSALFDAQVDGDDIDRLGLRRRPAPDAYLEAASRLTVHPIQALVVEAVLAGVAAARTGGFGLVIGVAGNAARAELWAASPARRAPELHPAAVRWRAGVRRVGRRLIVGRDGRATRRTA